MAINDKLSEKMSLKKWHGTLLKGSNETFKWNKSILEIGEWDDYQQELVKYIETELLLANKKIKDIEKKLDIANTRKPYKSIKSQHKVFKLKI